MRLSYRIVHPAVVVAMAALLACFGGGPRLLRIGQDACDYCRMSISDGRFGGEVVTSTGRVRTFDSVECLAGYVAAAEQAPSSLGVWVADYRTSELVPVASARFVVSDSIHSPMGRRLLALRADASPSAATDAFGGRQMTWTEVLALARTGAGVSSPDGARP